MNANTKAEEKSQQGAALSPSFKNYIKPQPVKVKIFVIAIIILSVFGVQFLINTFLPIPSDTIQLPKHLTKQEADQLKQIKILNSELNKEILVQSTKNSTNK